jgi:hypothetical protein
LRRNSKVFERLIDIKHDAHAMPKAFFILQPLAHRVQKLQKLQKFLAGQNRSG